jgi:hypothetical protein
MKGRFIGECTRLMCDIIVKCDECNIPGDLILLDFEKAFDSVEWRPPLSILKRFERCSLFNTQLSEL